MASLWMSPCERIELLLNWVLPMVLFNAVVDVISKLKEDNASISLLSFILSPMMPKVAIAFLFSIAVVVFIENAEVSCIWTWGSSNVASTICVLTFTSVATIFSFPFIGCCKKIIGKAWFVKLASSEVIIEIGRVPSFNWVLSYRQFNCFEITVDFWL